MKLAGPATFGRRDDGGPGASARGGRPDSTLEPHSGLRVKNPKFPAIVLAERLTNLCFVKLAQLRCRHELPPHAKRWAIGSPLYCSLALKHSSMCAKLDACETRWHNLQSEAQTAAGSPFGTHP